MNRFRVTFTHTIEQANDDGIYEPFDGSTRTVHHLKRHQMKFIEGLLLDAANKMHAEGMKHPDVEVLEVVIDRPAKGKK